MNKQINLKLELDTNIYKIAELRNLDIDISVDGVVFKCKYNDSRINLCPDTVKISGISNMSISMGFDIASEMISDIRLKCNLDISDEDIFDIFILESISIYIHYGDADDSVIKTGLAMDTKFNIKSAIVYIENYSNEVVFPTDMIRVDIDKDREFPVNNIFYMNKMDSYNITLLDQLSINENMEKIILFDIRQIINNEKYIQTSSYKNNGVIITLYQKENDTNNLLMHIQTNLSFGRKLHKVIKTIIDRQ